MFTSLKIENFRNFPRLEMQGFQSVNLITGLNGSGKSAILEAVFLNCEAGNPSSVMNINGIRGEPISDYTNERPFRTLFNDYSGSKPAVIAGQWKNDRKDTTPTNRELLLKPALSVWKFTPSQDGRPKISGFELDYKGAGLKSQVKAQWKEEGLNLQASPPGMRAGNFQVPATYRFTQDSPQVKVNIRSVFLVPAPRDSINFVYAHLLNATRDKDVPAIVKFASIIDKRLVNVVPLVENTANQVYVDIGLERLIPLTMMGAGFTNMLQIAIGVAHIKSKVVIIDEIEDGLHYTTFPRLAEVIVEFSQNSDVQFFISTHSGEFLDAFVDVARKLQFHDVCSFRVAERAGRKIVTRFDASELDSAKEIELDVR